MSIPSWILISASFVNSLNARKRRLGKTRQEMKKSYDKEKVAKELNWAKKSIGKLVKRGFHRKDDMAKWNNFASAPSKASKKEQTKQLKTASTWLNKFYDKRKIFLDEERERNRIIKFMNKKEK